MGKTKGVMTKPGLNGTKMAGRTELTDHQLLEAQQRAWQLEQEGWSTRAIAKELNHGVRTIEGWLESRRVADPRVVLNGHLEIIEHYREQAFGWLRRSEDLREQIKSTPEPTKPMYAAAAKVQDGLSVVEIAAEMEQSVETTQRWIDEVRAYKELQDEYDHAVATCQTWWSRLEPVVLISWRAAVAAATREGGAGAPQFAFVFPDVDKFYQEIREFRRGNPPLQLPDGKRKLTTKEWIEEYGKDIHYPTEYL